MSTQGQTADQEFLERLDAAIGCQQCGGPLTDSVSDYFCCEEHAEDYAEAHTEVLDGAGGIWGQEWTPADLADLEPVSWLPPRTWRLRRSTGDLDADWAALKDATKAATTEAQRRACAVRRDDLTARQRVIWAREWTLPRLTGNQDRDWNAFVHAETTATTPAQYAACDLRRADLEARVPGIGGPSWAAMQAFSGAAEGFAAGLREAPQWNYLGSSPLVHSRISWPITTQEQAQQAANRILASRSTDSDFDADPFGSRMVNNLPDIRESTFQVRGRCPSSRPAMLRYELLRDSDGALMASYAAPDGHQVSVELPPHMDASGCSWRILNSRGEVIRRFPATSRSLWATPDPAPAVSEGDTIQVTHDGETLRYTVDAIGPGSSMTLRRHREDDQSPIRGAEITHAIVDETTHATPQARALEARRNRNTGPAIRPGRVRGNVPGARR